MEKLGDHTASLSPPLSSTSCSSSKPSVEAFRKAGEVVKAGFNPVGFEIRKLRRFLVGNEALFLLTDSPVLPAHEDLQLHSH